jgi:hypothetical protein
MRQFSFKGHIVEKAVKVKILINEAFKPLDIKLKAKKYLKKC